MVGLVRDMNRGLLLCFLITLSNHAMGYRDNKDDPKDDFYDRNDYDYTYDEETDKRVKTIVQIKNVNVTTPRAATYEVTEIVMDIPNTSTRIGPVIINYTTPRALNNASSTPNNSNNSATYNNTNEATNGFKEGDDRENIKTKKNYLSIFHVKAEYDDKPNAPYHTDHHEIIHHRPGFKDYVFGIKRSIINGLSKFFNRHSHEHDTHEFGSHHHGVIHKYQRENSEAPTGFRHIFRHDLDDEHD